MSRELVEFSELIDEQFDTVDYSIAEPDDFWQKTENMFC